MIANFNARKLLKCIEISKKLTILFVRILTTLLHVISKSRVKMTGGNILSNQYRWKKVFVPLSIVPKGEKFGAN